MTGAADLRLPEHLASFPTDFVFGTSTAAYQIEGGIDEGGRGVSIWDTFTHTPGKIHRGENGDIACDHYHRWADDLDLMADLGYPGYRMSLSWTRLQPTGEGPLNPEGVRFYRDLLQGCLDRGIAPFVTLYHWDLPQPLQDAGGWPARRTAERFGEYAALCFDAFGDLLDNVITINETWCLSFLSHEWGVQAPGFTDAGLAVRAMHHALLGHGLALAEARKRVPHAKVGITNILSNITPLTGTAADADAARRLDIRMNRIVLEPCYLGVYSEEVRAEFASAGLDDSLVLDGDLECISVPGDFVGVNHYHNMFAGAADSRPNGTAISSVEPTPTSFGWSNTPDALYRILRRVAADFSTLPLVVTENGATFHDYVDPDGTINDVERIDYLRGYIDAVGRAIRDGVEVTGYFAWSFMDNFEWAEGYDKRFGLVFTDYRTQDRIPKASAYWYRDLINAWRANST